MPDRTTTLDPLDIPEWNRRATLRRQDDRSLLQKCRALANDLSKALGIIVILFGALAGLAGFMGVHVSGPTETVTAIALRQDTLSRQQITIDQRVSRLEAGAVATQQQLGDLTSDVRFLSYLSCVKDAGTDPMALNKCRDIITAYRRRAGDSP